MFSKGRPRKHIPAGYFTYEKNGIRLTYEMSSKGPLKRVEDIDILRQKSLQLPQESITNEKEKSVATNVQQSQQHYEENTIFNMTVQNTSYEYQETESTNDMSSFDYFNDDCIFAESYLNPTYFMGESMIENSDNIEIDGMYSNDFHINFNDDVFFQI